MVTPVAPNSYSQQWFASFHVPISDVRTKAEVDFVCSIAPLPGFSRIADVCCGMGRHARELAKRGYLVTGVERDEHVLAKARELGGGARYIQADVRDYCPESSGYDALIVMGQSFGHFDPETNQAILGQLTEGLRQRGLLVLDLWNQKFFESHQGERDFQLPTGAAQETKRVDDDRLFVHLTYPTGDEERFEWQLFTPESMSAAATPLGLRLKGWSSDFGDLGISSSSTPRMQFILERV